MLSICIWAMAQRIKNLPTMQETWVRSLGWKDPLEKEMDSIPVLGRSPGGGNGHPLQDPCLDNPMDRGAWQATVYGVTKSPT